jgi:hypothetical protein
VLLLGSALFHLRDSYGTRAGTLRAPTSLASLLVPSREYSVLRSSPCGRRGQTLGVCFGVFVRILEPRCCGYFISGALLPFASRCCLLSNYLHAILYWLHVPCYRSSCCLLVLVFNKLYRWWQVSVAACVPHLVMLHVM